MTSPPAAASARPDVIRIVADGAGRNNAVTVQMLALCPMLAVSVSVSAAAVLGALTTAVMAAAGFVVAAAREKIPTAARLPIFLVVVAALVGAADILMEALANDAHRRLGIFLPLIITNCAVLARLEVFASRQPAPAALADGLATGAGMTAAIVLLAMLRETAAAFGVASAMLPAGGFILFALMLAGIRLLVPVRPSQPNPAVQPDPPDPTVRKKIPA